MPDFGEPVTLDTFPLDASGNRVDVSGLTAIVRLPDGTATSPITPVHNTLGSYSVTYTPTQAGRHVAAWSGTGWAYTDVFNVWPTDPRFLLSLADARAALSWDPDPDGSDTDINEQVRLFSAATTEVIEDIVGPIVPVTRTETFGGRASAVLLKDMNVTVATVTQAGTTLVEGTDYTVGADAGIVYAGLPGGCARFGYQPVTVAYSTGTAVVPANITLAAAEELRFLWQTSRQGNRPAFGDVEDSAEFTPSGYAVPRRVIELCGNTRRKAWRPA